VIVGHQHLLVHAGPVIGIKRRDRKLVAAVAAAVESCVGITAAKQVTVMMMVVVTAASARVAFVAVATISHAASNLLRSAGPGNVSQRKAGHESDGNPDSAHD